MFGCVKFIRLIICLLLGSSLFLYPQPPKIYFESTRPINAFSILKDRFGFMWFGCQIALVKYDGSEFTYYRNIPFDSTSISNNWIWNMVEDENGNFWIGTNGGGLNHFDRFTERFSVYQHDPQDSNTVCGNIITSLFRDRDGSLWIGTAGQGLSHLYWDDAGKEHFRHYSHNPDNPAGLSGNFILTAFRDREGSLWIGTRENGVNRLDSTGGKMIHYTHDPDELYSIADNMVGTICEDTAGNLWFGPSSWSHFGGGGGLSRLRREDRQRGKFLRYQHDPEDPFSLSSNKVTYIFVDSAGIMWCGTTDAGLNAFSLSKFLQDEQQSGGRRSPP